MKRVIFVPAIFLLAFVVFTAIPSHARIGVGIGTGKIVVDEDLKPGTIYTLPSVTIFNTGDETHTYSVRVAYHNDQKEKMPDRTWFSFGPSTFELEPGGSQVVSIRLNLPIRTEPGDYFAYIEGFPSPKSKGDGSTRVGVAAASKLYFTVVPGSTWEGIYFRMLSVWREYDPWPQRMLIAGGVVILLLVARRFLNIEINIRKPTRRHPESSKKESSS